MSSEKCDQKRKQILISAAQTFRGRGFATASMAQIARDLGMRKSNLYYYFRSKEEILFASHLHLMSELSNLMDVTEASNAGAEAKLRALMEGFIHLVIDELHASALTHNIRGMTQEHQQEIIRLRDSFEACFRSLVREGIAQGTFRHANVKLVGFAVFGAINWIHRWHDQRGESNSEAIAAEFSDFFLAGLRDSCN